MVWYDHPFGWYHPDLFGMTDAPSPEMILLVQGQHPSLHPLLQLVCRNGLVFILLVMLVVVIMTVVSQASAGGSSWTRSSI